MELTADVLRIREPERVCKKIEAFIGIKVDELHRDGVILGLSGGVDSTLVAYLCARSVEPDKVLALYMPDKDSEKRSGEDAKTVADELGIRFEVVDLTPILQRFDIYGLLPTRILGSRSLAGWVFSSYYRVTRALGKDAFEDSLMGTSNKIAGRGNAYLKTKHRVRMVILYCRAEIENLLVVGAANKSEHLTGLFVKYGCDHVADIMPLQGLYKTQVRELASFVKLPQEIIDKPPIPDLLPGLKDEDFLGPYQTLDLILLGLENGLPVGEIAYQLSIEPREVERIRRYVAKSACLRDRPYRPDLTS